MFTAREGDNRLVYSARHLQPNAVDVGFTHVQIKDLLQQHCPRPRQVGWLGRDVVKDLQFNIAQFRSIVHRLAIES
jgi:hypothetical protein